MNQGWPGREEAGRLLGWSGRCYTTRRGSDSAQAGGVPGPWSVI